MLIGLHLAELAHQNMESVLSIDVNLGEIINGPLGLVLAQSTDQILDLSLGQYLFEDLGNALFSGHLPQLYHLLDLCLRLLVFILFVATVRVDSEEGILLFVGCSLSAGLELCSLFILLPLT